MTEVTVVAQAEPTLAGDFPPVNEEQWREAVDRVLKGAPFDRLGAFYPHPYPPAW